MGSFNLDPAQMISNSKMLDSKPVGFYGTPSASMFTWLRHTEQTSGQIIFFHGTLKKLPSTIILSHLHTFLEIQNAFKTEFCHPGSNRKMDMYRKLCFYKNSICKVRGKVEISCGK